MKQQVEKFRYWLCESSITDTKFEIDYETYTKVLYDLTNENINHKMVNLTEMIIDFDTDIDQFMFDYYIVVDTKTFLQYSEIC